ncbi:MAG: HAMP domain-containing sensor histidine kinase [Alkalispirochaeta sp.]
MKGGLTGRLVISHVAVALVAVLVFASVIITATGRQAVEAGVRVDRATAYRLAPWIEEYLRRNGTWGGLSRAITPRRDGRSAPQPPGMPMMHMPPMAESRRGVQIGQLLDRPFAITDRTGRIVFRRGIPEDASIPPLNPAEGVPIRLGEDVAFALFVGGMIEEQRNPLSAIVYRNMLRASALAGIVLLGTVVVVSIFWARRFLQPITAVREGAEALGAGRYDHRVTVPPGDHELSVLARTFNTMAEEIEHQELSRRRFVGDAAHELRTPIALLSTRVEMLRDGVYLADDEQFAALTEDLRRLHRLVEDLQILARADAGRLSLSIDHITVSALLDEARRRILPHADNAGVFVEMHADDDAVIAVDSARFQQIMTNILGNAIRHTPRGGTIRIESIAAADTDTGEPGKISIAVEDTGPGIPREERERVFERFVRLDVGRGRSDGGSGLGLAIASEYVRLLGGTIAIEDPRHASGGARFVLSFPQAPATPS